jgi:hypothetical protein
MKQFFSTLLLLGFVVAPAFAFADDNDGNPLVAFGTATVASIATCDDPYAQTIDFGNLRHTNYFRYAEEDSASAFGEWTAMPPSQEYNFTASADNRDNDAMIIIQLTRALGEVTHTIPVISLNFDSVDCDDSASNDSSEEEPADSTDEESSTAPAGTLIQAEGFDAIYYLGADEKRHVFPHSNVYFTWYDDFDDVMTVERDVLGSYKIGLPMTYAPGSLVKIQSDPKVYLVSEQGVLRHVSTEAIASSLFGNDWNTLVYDVPVSFFSHYSISEPIKTEDFTLPNAGSPRFD